jgi:hypothetical protein
MAEQKLAEREARHGPCPASVRIALLNDMLDVEQRRRFGRIIVYRHRDRSITAVDGFRQPIFVERIRLPGRKGSRLRKRYEKWMRRRVKPDKKT